MDTKKLASALTMQLGHFKELHALLERETHELSEIHLDAMAEINNTKMDLGTRIDAHAKILKQEIIDVTALEGLPVDSPLGDLAAKLKFKGNREIPRLHTEINVYAVKIRQLLEINREIAENFASSAASSLELLTRLINQSNFYGATGGYKQCPTGSVLINKEA